MRPSRSTAAPRNALLPLRRRSETGFTLVEIMLALFIFAGVVAAIYSSWSAILRSSKVGLTVAAEAQRKRMAVLALEEALNSVQMFGQNVRYYSFEVETSRDEAYLSLVARLPRSFPRGGQYGDHVVRRLTFRLRPDAAGQPELVLWQQPLLFDPDPDQLENPLVLARDVRLFTLEFWGPRSKDWETEWPSTNQLPRLVRFTLGFGDPGRRQLAAEDVVTRVVVLPSAGVPAAMQTPAGGRGGQPPGNLPGGGPLPASPGGNPGGPQSPSRRTFPGR
jgi:prepilin-type N-terminal cleavage/methylation domain-containing protein